MKNIVFLLFSVIVSSEYITIPSDGPFIKDEALNSELREALTEYHRCKDEHAQIIRSIEELTGRNLKKRESELDGQIKAFSLEKNSYYYWMNRLNSLDQSICNYI